MHRSIWSLLASVIFFAPLAATVAQYVPADSLLSYAEKKISPCGVVDKRSDGFVYLKISDRYVKDLLPRLMALLPPQESSRLIPPFSSGGGIGSHISIIYPSELKAPIRSLPERGRSACFTITGVYFADLDTGPYQRIYFLNVVSQDLQKIRINYGLQPLYKNNDFRIAIGAIPRAAQ